MTAPVISSRQIRAARGLIGWSQTELAEAVGIARGTLAAIEKDTGNPTFDILHRIRLALENRQVEFLAQEGVRFRQPTIYYDDRPGANRRLLEEVFDVASNYQRKSGVNDILIFGVREEDAEQSVGEYLEEHISRLKNAGLEEKILCSPNTRAYVAPDDWYRRLPELATDKSPIPVMTYGEKLAVIEWEPSETITVVDSKPLANAFRLMFQYIWNARQGR
jgi:transcriptional regulator with XRE-family HTH domain